MPDKAETETSSLEDDILIEGIMAAGALIALADHDLKIDETLALQGMLEGPELLRRCDIAEALKVYTFYVKLLRDDFPRGKEEALEAISLCREDIQGPALIVRGGMAVAHADQDLSDSELNTLEEICQAVGIEGVDILGLAGARPSHSN